MPQRGEVHRLREKHVEARVIPTLLVGGGEVSANGDGRHSRITLPSLGNKIVAVPVRQTDIAQNHIHRVRTEKRQAARHRVARVDAVPPTPEDGRADRATRATLSQTGEAAEVVAADSRGGKE